MSVMDDFRVQLDRQKGVPTADYMETAEACAEQGQMAAAAEGAGQPHAYVEWMNLAAMAYRRAQYLADGRPEYMGEWGRHG